jgi:FkbM family methyltransferase
MKEIKIKDPQKWKEYIVREAKYPLPPECKGGICVDAGTNIGDFPINQGKRFDKYICFDVFQENLDECVKNHQNLGLDIEYHKRAVYSESNKDVNVYAYNKADTDDLEHFGNSGNIRCIEISAPEGQGWKSENQIGIVNSISLEEVIDTYGPINLLKIDVEGSEYAFLEGKDLSQINYITGEFHFELEDIDRLVDHISKTHNLYIRQGRHIFTFKKK